MVCSFGGGGRGRGGIRELPCKISLQGQKVVDLCKICMKYIPAKREIRPVVTCREGQCFWEDKEVLREKPGALPRLRESTGLFQGINNGVTYPSWQECILFIPDLYSYIAK